MMNHAIKASTFIGNQASFPHKLRSISCFHSSPVLERRRKNHPVHRYNYYTNRVNKINSKRAMLHDISDYADHLFQSWKEDLHENSTSFDDSSWYKKPYWSRGAKINGFNSTETRWGKYNKRRGGFDFCASDDEVETIFDSAFSRKGHRYWSFNSSENFSYNHYSSRDNNSNSWNWRYETDYEDDHDDDEEEELKRSRQSSLVSERLALGLKDSGPLKLEDVKIAYRACALKWHPDRHQGSSKAAAEEKFKHCSAAYKTLCNKLAV